MRGWTGLPSVASAGGPGSDRWALAPLRLDPVSWDAALTFVLDVVGSSARNLRPQPRAGELAEHWPDSSARLASYLGDDHPVARSVGAAGEALDGVNDPALAWEFGLARVIDGLGALAPA